MRTAMWILTGFLAFCAVCGICEELIRLRRSRVKTMDGIIVASAFFVPLIYWLCSNSVWWHSLVAGAVALLAAYGVLITKEKWRIAGMIDSDPNTALELVKELFEGTMNLLDLDEYEKYLMEILEATDQKDLDAHRKALLFLQELYKGEKYKKGKNDKKYERYTLALKAFDESVSTKENQV